MRVCPTFFQPDTLDYLLWSSRRKGAATLSSFTENGAALVAGTNVGGLGTLVASLTCLISFRLYAKSPGARPGRYLLVFTGINVLLLALLWPAAWLLI